jgi:hypothetical protein
MDDEVVPFAGARKDPRGQLAHVGALVIKRDASAQLVDVVFQRL